MKSLLLPTFLFFFLLPLASYAQPPYRKIATQEVHKRLLDEHPEMRERQRDIERHTTSFQKNGSPTQVTIPVIFHIIYNSEKERLSEAQVMSQIEALNRDFRMRDFSIRHPADTLEDFAARAADTEIEFCLAALTDRSGGNIALHYVRSNTPIWQSDDAVKFAKEGGADVVDPRHYLNVWVCRLDNAGSGYAQMPGGPEETDGIVIDYRFFGTMGTAAHPYSEGKTLTHLVGNYLNLFDLWGTEPCQDDFVEDTPIHNAPNYGCPGYKHISTCLGNPVEMTMNFMDNTDDACMYMFTQGQKMRMQAVLAKKGPRGGLVMGGAACELSVEERTLDSSKVEHPASNAGGNLAVAVFPNPASREVNLMITAGSEGVSTIAVYNSLGSLVYRTDFHLNYGNQQLTLDSSKWAEGPYYLLVQTAQEIASKLFFIRHP